MAGGPAAAQAVTTLLELTPAGPDVVASWDRDPRTRRARAGAEAPGALTDDELYARMYPTGEQAAVWAERRARGGLEPDRLAQADARHAWLTSQAAGVAPPPVGLPELTDEDLAPDPGGHDATNTVHDHLHSDYAGGQHSHLHSHNGDASHEPGTFLHAHGTHSEGPAASAGELGELYDRLFGRPQ
jgi:hypothetical protein